MSLVDGTTRDSRKPDNYWLASSLVAALPISGRAAHNLRTQNEPAYDVRFRTDDLWPQAADKATVHVAVFESYLEKAP